jgi:hypothetical protein
VNALKLLAKRQVDHSLKIVDHDERGSCLHG